MADGLSADPKTIPTRFFYDSRGSDLFDEITRLPEYYPTRTEMALIPRVAEEIADLLAPEEIIELGSGSSEKIFAFLGPAGVASSLKRYVPFDFDPGVVESAVEAMGRAHSQIEAQGVVGDMLRHVPLTPTRHGRRLVVFFGSTIGNFDPGPRRRFLRSVRKLLGPEGHLLLGVDLIKDASVLENAYNDAAGVTAEFNRNILNVVNRTAGANFDPATFGHRAFYNRRDRRIEMHLVSERAQTVTLSGPGRTIALRRGEGIWTESSYKFDRPLLEEILGEADMAVQRWYADPGNYFALVLAGPA